MIHRRLFTAGLALAAAVALVFLLLPLVAIFLRVPPGELFAQLGSDVALDAIVVTLKANTIAQALILLIGTPTAYLIASRGFRGRDLVVTLVELPLVLPPAVAGIGLLAAFGRLGLLGSTFEVLGITISFTQTAVVLAVTYVACPFYLRQAIASFEALDHALLDASRTLGAGPARTFLRIASRPARLSPSRGGSASSARRSCSPAASRA
jgi:molybdate transport system permease protein